MKKENPNLGISLKDITTAFKSMGGHPCFPPKTSRPSTTRLCQPICPVLFLSNKMNIHTTIWPNATKPDCPQDI